MNDTALFDLDEAGQITPPVLEPTKGGYGPHLTPYGRHEGLGPGVWDGFGALCGDTHYGSVESTGRTVWIWHACSRTNTHDHHKCDRCEETW